MDIRANNEGERLMYILITGDPVEGFEYHGPFTDEHEAISYGEKHFPDSYWWDVELEDKDDVKESN
jgi:hypothetical protein